MIHLFLLFTTRPFPQFDSLVVSIYIPFDNMAFSRTQSTTRLSNIPFLALLLLSYVRPSKCEATSSKNDKKIGAPVIIGICVAVFLVLVIALIFTLRKRRIQKKAERADIEAGDAAEFVRDMEERKRRLGSVYTGQRKEMEKTIMNSPPMSYAMEKQPPPPPPKKPERVVLVPDNLW